MSPSARVLAVLLLAGCAGAAPVQGPPPSSTAPAPALPCLTVRDQELACDVQCEPLLPVLQRCARTAHGAGGRYSISVRASSDGRGGVEAVRAQLPPQAPPELRSIGACMEDAMLRYRYCLGPPPRGTPLELPIAVSLPAL